MFDLFHRDSLRFHKLRNRQGRLGLIEARPGAAAQLLGAEGGDVDVKKTALDGRRFRVNDRAIFGCGRRLGDSVHLDFV